MPGLEGLLTRLLESKVRFVVVDSYTAIAPGSSVLTRDIDICTSFDAANIEAPLAATEDLHPVLRMTPARTACDCSALTTSWTNLYLDADRGQLDCLGEIEGIGTREEVSLGDTSCRILTIDALIRTKEAVGRPKNRETVIQLRAVRERLPRECAGGGSWI